MSVIYKDDKLVIEVTEEAEGRIFLNFKGNCKVENIASVKEALKDVLDNRQACSITFDEGADVDLSAIQLIHAINNTGSQKNIKVRVTGELPLAVADAFKLSGYDKFEWISAR